MNGQAASAPSGCRLFVGFAVLPVVDAALAYYAMRLRAGAGDRDLAVLVGVIGLVVTVSAAVPVVSSLMQRGPLSLKRLLLAGAVLGNAPGGAYLLFLALIAIIRMIDGTMSQFLMPLWPLVAGLLSLVAIGSFMGITSAFVFWLVAVKAWGKHAAEEARV